MRYCVLLCLVLVTKATRLDERCAGFKLNDKEYECDGQEHDVKTAKICDEALQCEKGRIKVLSLNTTRTEALDKVKCRCNGLKQCDITKRNVCSDDSKIKEAEVEYICKPRGPLNCCESGNGKEANDACGFKLTCDCCGNSSLTFGQCHNTGQGNLFLGQNNEYIPPVKRSLSYQRRQEASDEEPDIDEDGCHLRVVVYEGEKHCIPGNMAQTIKRIARIMKRGLGTCKAAFEDNCTEALNYSAPYKFKVAVSLSVYPTSTEDSVLLATQTLAKLERIKSCAISGSQSDTDKELICDV